MFAYWLCVSQNKATYPVEKEMIHKRGYTFLCLFAWRKKKTQFDFFYLLLFGPEGKFSFTIHSWIFPFFWVLAPKNRHFRFKFFPFVAWLSTFWKFNQLLNLPNSPLPIFKCSRLNFNYLVLEYLKMLLL